MTKLLLILLLSTLPGCVAEADYETQKPAPDFHPAPIDGHKDADSEAPESVQASPNCCCAPPCRCCQCGELPVPVEVAAKPVVTVYLAPFNCPPCEQWKRDMASMPEFDWQIGTVEPAWLQAYPTFTFIGADGGLYYVEGWSKQDFLQKWEGRN